MKLNERKVRIEFECPHCALIQGTWASGPDELPLASPHVRTTGWLVRNCDHEAGGCERLVIVRLDAPPIQVTAGKFAAPGHAPLA